MRGMVERAWETFPDYHEEMLAIVVEGDQAAVHLRITGTQQGAGPLPATGRRVEFEEMILFTFGPDGRVVRQRGIADNLTALIDSGTPQIPDRPDLPIGSWTSTDSCGILRW